MSFAYLLFFKFKQEVIPLSKISPRLNSVSHVNSIVLLFNFFHVSYKNSKVLMPNLSQINKCKFFEQDIFSVEKKYFDFFDVVRVTNLLNYSYFSKSKIKIAILNLNKISKENSIVLINRTNNRKKNSASF